MKMIIIKTMKIDYLKNPRDITQKSFSIIESETSLLSLPKEIQPVARRMIHTCGMPDIINHLSFTEGATKKGKSAIENGSPILVDVNMIVAGINTSNLSNKNKIICKINDPQVSKIAKQQCTTRSAAALELWKPILNGAVVAIGNAPTALFRLLEIINSGIGKPSLIIATPPGFVGAKESKDLLIQNTLSIPYIVISGRMGGSALAAATVNALAGDKE